MKPKLIPVYKCNIEPLQFGDYPVAYWGYREVFCTHHHGYLRRFVSEEAPDYGSSENCPVIALTNYLARFSLFEKLPSRGSDLNQSTVKMKSGVYISFADKRVYIGTDIRADPEFQSKDPLWAWSEPDFLNVGKWVSRED